MGSGRSAVTSPVATTSRTAAAVAGSTRRWPTMAAGAWLQAPMQGAGRTRTRAGSRLARSSASSASPPARAQLRLSQTRTVTGGGGVSPSFTTSKWW